MTICVVANYALDEQQALVEELFSPILNRHLVQPEYAFDSVFESSLKTMYKVTPIKDVN